MEYIQMYSMLMQHASATKLQYLMLKKKTEKRETKIENRRMACAGIRHHREESTMEIAVDCRQVSLNGNLLD